MFTVEEVDAQRGGVSHRGSTDNGGEGMQVHLVPRLVLQLVNTAVPADLQFHFLQLQLPEVSYGLEAGDPPSDASSKGK